MSRVYEALRQSELERGATPTLLDPDTFLSAPMPAQPAAEQVGPDGLAWDTIVELAPAVGPESRVVTLTDDNSLAAEKFRLLRGRVRHLHERQQLRSLVITSAVPD